MLISTLYLEEKALKAYFKEGDHLLEYEDDNGGRISPELNPSNKVDDSADSDVMYHGGHADGGHGHAKHSHRDGKKSKTANRDKNTGICAKIFGQNILNSNHGDRPSMEDMSPD